MIVASQRWPATAGLLAIASLAACKRGGGGGKTTPAPPMLPPVLGEVAVRDLTTATPAPARLDVAALAVVIRKRAAATGLFGLQTPDAEAAPVARIRIDVGLDLAEVKDRGAAHAAVRLRIDTRPAEAPGAIDEDVTAAAEQVFTMAGAKRDVVFAQLVERTVADLLESLRARRRLRDAPAGELQTAMRADGGEHREEAIRMAGQRRLREVVPLLLDLLNHADEPVRDAALGALIEMKETSAVAVITRTRSFRDKRELRKILDAVSILGGVEALEYLTYVVETHDDPEIRKMAGDAKARLERRGGAPR